MARRSRGELARLRREIEQLRSQAEEAVKPPIRVGLAFDPSPLGENVRRRLAGDPVELNLNGLPIDGALPVVEVEAPAAVDPEPVPSPAPPAVPAVPVWVPRGPVPVGAWRSQRGVDDGAFTRGLDDRVF